MNPQTEHIEPEFKVWAREFWWLLIWMAASEVGGGLWLWWAYGHRPDLTNKILFGLWITTVMHVTSVILMFFKYLKACDTVSDRKEAEKQQP